MLKDHAKAEIENLVLEVNFDEEKKDYIKLSIEDKTAIIKYTDLFSFMFFLATKEQQAKMIPVKEELGNQYMKQIHVRLSKDLKAGEEMVVNVPINIPEIIENQIRFELENKKED